MSESEITIERPQGAALIACLGFLFDNLPVAERAKLVAESMRNAASKKTVVLSALKSERLIAAWGANLAAGGQAMLFPPRIQGDEGQAAIAPLFEALQTELFDAGIGYLQATLPLDADLGSFQQVGFAPIAKLSYLVAEVEDTAPLDESLTLAPFQDSDIDRLYQLVTATYVDSLDCPNMEGMRDIADVVQGYRNVGESGAEHWLFVQDEGVDIGCLLLADHPKTDRCELVYMGLNSESRGKGKGQAIAEWAKSKTRDIGRKQLVVAVDSENTPAINTYVRCKFHLVSEQQVLAKSIVSGEEQGG